MAMSERIPVKVANFSEQSILPINHVSEIEGNMIYRITIGLLLTALVTQNHPVIDATGEITQLSRHIVGGHSGSVGRKLPVQLQGLSSDAGIQNGDSFFIDFVITNKGQSPLKVPTDVRPADFEPQDSGARSFEHLSLFVTAGEKDSLILKGGADLYGADDVTGSILILQPSESVRVHAKCSLVATNGRPMLGAQILTAHLSLRHETLSPKGLDAELNSEDRGSASSQSWSVKIDN